MTGPRIAAGFGEDGDDFGIERQGFRPPQAAHLDFGSRRSAAAFGNQRGPALRKRREQSPGVDRHYSGRLESITRLPSDIGGPSARSAMRRIGCHEALPKKGDRPLTGCELISDVRIN